VTEISRVHADEPGAVAMLEQAITALSEAIDSMPISGVVALKAQVVTIQTATRELGMSKEAQDLAAEAVRRAEWALGRAVRTGQDDGTVARQGYPLQRMADEGGKQAVIPEARVSDFVTKNEWRGDGGIAALTEAEPAEFDAAIEAAKAEGNLSRTNVVRKIRESKPDATTTKPTKSRKPLPDAARNAGWDLRKAVERLERIAADDRFGSNKEQVASHLRSHLLNAVEVCQDLLARIDN
jgi:hypothetical protein